MELTTNKPEFEAGERVRVIKTGELATVADIMLSWRLGEYVYELKFDGAKKSYVKPFFADQLRSAKSEQVDFKFEVEKAGGQMVLKVTTETGVVRYTYGAPVPEKMKEKEQVAYAADMLKDYLMEIISEKWAKK